MFRASNLPLLNHYVLSLSQNFSFKPDLLDYRIALYDMVFYCKVKFVLISWITRHCVFAIRLGPYWFAWTLSKLYINLNVKHGSNLIRTFLDKIQIMNNKCNCFRGHGGPLHKIQRYCGHQNVGKCRTQKITTNV